MDRFTPQGYPAPGVGAALDTLGFTTPPVSRSPGQATYTNARAPGTTAAAMPGQTMGVRAPGTTAFGSAGTAPGGRAPGSSGIDPLASPWANNNAWFATQMQPYGGGSPGGVMPNATTTPAGGMSSPGGDWGNIDKLNAYISQAAGATGVDPNLIKAVMKLESDGVWQSSPAGAIGYMQVMPFWGSDLGLNLNDPYQNILAGATVLQQMLSGANGDVREALRHYHGIGWDGYTDDQQYADIVLGNYNSLKAYGTPGVGANTGFPMGGAVAGGTGTGTGTGGGGWQQSFQSMFGTSTVPDWGEFNAPSSNGLYGYGTDYGLNGSNHTGLDIPLDPGSAMRAGFSGHVVCAGTGVGNGQDSCAAFNCSGFCPVGSAGRIEIMSDDGNTVLIYGHSSGSAVTPGQRVSAGQLVGYSGGENSGHVHLEARVRDPSMPSGWRIVDPRSVLGGGVPSTGAYGGAGSYGAPVAPSLGNGSFYDWWHSQIAGG